MYIYPISSIANLNCLTMVFHKKSDDLTIDINQAGMNGELL